jgi:hypothetical protein
MKELGMKQRQRWAGLFCLVSTLTACSVDADKNKQHVSQDVCENKLHGHLVRSYCVVGGAGAIDSGTPDGGNDNDSGPAAGGGGASGHGGAGGVHAGGGGNAGVGRGGAGGNGGTGGSAAGSGGQSGACTKGATQSCYTGSDATTADQPPCHRGTQTCDGSGKWGDCKDDLTPNDDTCNGLDDDCDGRTDEGLSGQPCTVDDSSVKGICKMGISLCTQGTLDCVQYVQPGVESCNGSDDDCDGTIDEDTTTACYDANTAGCTSDNKGGYTCVGQCASGTRACVDGKYSTTCSGAVTPVMETCTTAGSNAVDENCNAQVDEGCSCTTNDTVNCYSGMPASTAGFSPCRRGIQTCSGGVYGSCVGEVDPVAETCANEGVDDDCNGTVDDVPIRGTSCSSTSTAKGVCKDQAVWQCQSGQAVCVDGTGSNEVCDTAGKDENCNGQVNEGFNLMTDNNNCGVCGNRCATGKSCCAGNCVDTTASNANCGTCGNSCGSGVTCCSSVCRNTSSDNSNCGSCGKTCGLLTGCNSGTCKLLN